NHFRATRWAIAATLLFAGVALGRLMAPQPYLEKLAAALEPKMRAAVASELLAKMDVRFKRQSRDIELLEKEISGVRNQEFANYTSLRKDLETVAFQTQENLKGAREQLLQLATQK